jgi:acyl carrier protein
MSGSGLHIGLRRLSSSFNRPDGQEENKMTETTAERVKRIIIAVLAMDEADFELPEEPDSVTDDSLEKIEIGMALEDEFAIDNISDEEMESVKTVGQWTDIIVRKLADKVAA